MTLSRFIKLSFVSFLVVVFFASCNKHEHPSEHPAESVKGSAITKDQLADAIEDYVAKAAELHEGYFVAFDEKTGETLKLALDKVHRKRLSRIGDNEYFACADFTALNGKVYDLDVFMTGADKDNLTFSEFMIHKEDGKERYTWHQQDGLWKRKPIGQAETEHPIEHPEKKTEHPAEHPEEKTEHPTEYPK